MTVFLNMKTRGFIFYNVTPFAESFDEIQASPVGAVDCLKFTNIVAVLAQSNSWNGVEI
jgi:hypothetical protein